MIERPSCNATAAAEAFAHASMCPDCRRETAITTDNTDKKREAFRSGQRADVRTAMQHQEGGDDAEVEIEKTPTVATPRFAVEGGPPAALSADRMRLLHSAAATKPTSIGAGFYCRGIEEGCSLFRGVPSKPPRTKRTALGEGRHYATLCDALVSWPLYVARFQWFKRDIEDWVMEPSAAKLLLHFPAGGCQGKKKGEGFPSLRSQANGSSEEATSEKRETASAARFGKKLPPAAKQPDVGSQDRLLGLVTQRPPGGPATWHRPHQMPSSDQQPTEHTIVARGCHDTELLAPSAALFWVQNHTDIEEKLRSVPRAAGKPPVCVRTGLTACVRLKIEHQQRRARMQACALIVAGKLLSQQTTPTKSERPRTQSSVPIPLNRAMCDNAKAFRSGQRADVRTAMQHQEVTHTKAELLTMTATPAARPAWLESRARVQHRIQAKQHRACPVHPWTRAKGAKHSRTAKVTTMTARALHKACTPRSALSNYAGSQRLLNICGQVRASEKYVRRTCSVQKALKARAWFLLDIHWLPSVTGRYTCADAGIVQLKGFKSSQNLRTDVCAKSGGARKAEQFPAAAAADPGAAKGGDDAEVEIEKTPTVATPRFAVEGGPPAALSADRMRLLHSAAATKPTSIGAGFYCRGIEEGCSLFRGVPSKPPRTKRTALGEGRHCATLCDALVSWPLYVARFQWFKRDIEDWVMDPSAATPSLSSGGLSRQEKRRRNPITAIASLSTDLRTPPQALRCTLCAKRTGLGEANGSCEEATSEKRETASAARFGKKLPPAAKQPDVGSQDRLLGLVTQRPPGGPATWHRPHQMCKQANLRSSLKKLGIFSRPSSDQQPTEHTLVARGCHDTELLAPSAALFWVQNHTDIEEKLRSVPRAAGKPPVCVRTRLTACVRLTIEHVRAPSCEGPRHSTQTDAVAVAQLAAHD
ncbi:unnamed protein product [Symbiodinium sp. CCMP2592]|nr:unnamed protein product [Symbiodinium sp. CCMP2592]